ncbi:MAG: hypothetical protein MZV70_60325 [Desulfobacterales bacterium]|nr:hypothetical protein [Desulfobacterales bacterium]
MAMMRLVNVSRKKDFFILAGSLALLAAALFLQFGLAGDAQPRGDDPRSSPPATAWRACWARSSRPASGRSRLLAEGFSARGFRLLRPVRRRLRRRAAAPALGRRKILLPRLDRPVGDGGPTQEARPHAALTERLRPGAAAPGRPSCCASGG